MVKLNESISATRLLRFSGFVISVKHFADSQRELTTRNVRIVENKLLDLLDSGFCKCFAVDYFYARKVQLKIFFVTHKSIEISAV